MNAVPRLPSCTRPWLLGCAGLLLAGTALAQGIYRSDGPNGSTSFSDRPTPSTSPAPATRAPGGANPSGSSTMPYELRQVASRYPVTLYTTTDCAPCNSGRNLLNARGIPYVEKTINTHDDQEALKRLSGQGSLPLLTIGGQQVRGYSDTEWTQYLDAAGYPKQSALPSNYRRPASAPLVVVQPPAASNPTQAASPAGSPAPAPMTPPVQNPDNPAGIRF